MKLIAVAGYEVADKPEPPILINSPSATEKLLRPIKKKDREHLVLLCLNARGVLIHRETISIGTLSASLVHPREVFKPAIMHSAAAVIVAHNHPSGDVQPSAEDKDATHRLVRAGELIGIPVLDHVIVGTQGKFSFKENGLI